MGLLAGAALGLATVCLVEVQWELHWHCGPNSMPGFVYLFFCIPLSILGLAIAQQVAKRGLRNSAAMAAVAGFASVLPAGGSILAFAQFQGRIS